METIKRFARASGFSTAVARQITKSRRASSIVAYQAKWSIYRSWCHSRGHSISNPSISKIADFLLYLWEVRKLSPPSIRAYRSMLSAVFKFKLPSLGCDPIIKDLLRSFSIEKPRLSSSFPSWDLNKVLSFLMSDTFVPLQTIDFKLLTMKVLFLVALATAKRVGELQALSASVARRGEDMVLSYLPSFIAKTETAINPLPRSFILKSLADFAGDLEEGSLLCPVKSVFLYLDRCKSIVGRPRSLFVSPKRPGRPISKNALSFFLRKTIFDAGAVGGDGGPPPRAHSIRGIAASVAFLKNVSISRVLEAASWRSNSVFTSFYFKEVQVELDGVRSLGPIVAAGSVIH